MWGFLKHSITYLCIFVIFCGFLDFLHLCATGGEVSQTAGRRPYGPEITRHCGHPAGSTGTPQGGRGAGQPAAESPTMDTKKTAQGGRGLGAEQVGSTARSQHAAGSTTSTEMKNARGPRSASGRHRKRRARGWARSGADALPRRNMEMHGWRATAVAFGELCTQQH